MPKSSKKPKRIKFAQDQASFDAQAREFLETNGFPVDGAHEKLFGAFVQHSDEREDSFDPVSLAKAMRKQKANELAFYLMYPEKRPKEEVVATSEANSNLQD